MSPRCLARRGRVVLAVLAVPLLQSCADERSGPAEGSPHAGGAASGTGGASGGGAQAGAGGAFGSGGAEGGAGGAVGSGGTEGGSGGAVDGGGADGGAGGADGGAGWANDGGGAGGAGDGGSEPDGGRPPLADIVEGGGAAVSQAPRPAYGGLVATNDGERVYVVESRRDVEAGPFGLPWRSRFRLAAYDSGVEAWDFEAEPDDVIGDVVVHGSGEVTLSVERHLPAGNAYDLVRLTRAGEVIGVTTLLSPGTIPAADYGADDLRPLFRMKSAFADATAAGWVRLLPDDEGLVVAFLSFIAVPANEPGWNRMALGLEALDWQSNAYVERWARVVEGRHGAEPAAWAYDELRWREQAIRPFFARDEASGDLLVGRAWNQTRCEANVSTFAEFGLEECVLGAAVATENERLPLAVTRFDRAGVRRGTRILRPDENAAEQVPFALAARGGELAVVGSVVRELPDGSKKTYPDANGFVDYDGYVAIYDGEGALLRHHDYDLGRGDMLAGLRWTPGGIVGVGSSGWDRWQGGMSISRGASPLFVWFSQDGADTRARVVPLGDGSRHWNLHDVVVLDGAVVGHGFSDAPITHSADSGGTAARTFGPLQVRLEP